MAAAQEKIVDKTEDRSVQADPERESHDGNDSESGRFAELSQRETDFVHDCSQLESLFIILCAARDDRIHGVARRAGTQHAISATVKEQNTAINTAPASMAPTS